MKNYLERASTVRERIDELAAISKEGDLFGSKTFIEKSRLIESWMQQAGLDTHLDNIGNIHGKLKSNNQGAKTFLIGSHFDTGINEDKFEGTLGILAGLDVVAHLNKTDLPFHIELIAFAEEEGIRFNHTRLGSKAVAGIFKNKFLELKDKNGESLAEVLRTMQLVPEKIKSDAIPAEELLGYFEIHVEQGDFLSEKNVPVGIPESIYGQKRIEIRFIGKEGHAGSIPMSKRHDALAAAAKFILSVEKYARKEKRNITTTIGKLTVRDAASNKIPGEVTCIVDVRSDDAELLSEAYETINSNCEKICDKRNIYFEWNLLQETDPVSCSKKLRKLLTAAISEKNIPFASMKSGAVYDAAIIAKITPVCLLLLRPVEENNHSTAEDEQKSIATALEIADHFIKNLTSLPEKNFSKKEK
ncbi:MAG TPA: hydantoinase/carbamoylase family amidase [Hanamia sp.]|nr:hydantoinase/carbamoylase family amidase [Hanamia sp.]